MVGSEANPPSNHDLILGIHLDHIARGQAYRLGDGEVDLDMGRHKVWKKNVVGIDDAHELSFETLEDACSGSELTEILMEVDDGEAGIIADTSRNYCAAVIRRAVVHDKTFEGRIVLRADRSDRSINESAVIVVDDRERYERNFQHHWGLTR